MEKNWTKILLVAVLLVLAGEGIWLALGYSAPDGASDAGAGAGQNVAPLPPEAAQQVEAWSHPPVWTLPADGRQLFTPRRLLYFVATQKVELSTPETKIDGIPLDWLIKNGLNASDPDVARQDPDGDGFDNLTEYLSGSDPRDPKSHPSYAKLLRVKSFDAKPFSMTFASVNDFGGGEKIFQINTPNGHRPTNNVKIGDSFEGFKVVAYRPKQGPKKIGDMEVVADISELELTKEATGETVVLLYQEPRSAPDVSATIVLLLPNSFGHPVKVAQGHDFSLPASPNADTPAETLHYKLLSVDAAGAKLVSPETQETLTVPPLTPEEAAHYGAPPKQ